jgi:prepilin-type N-terminal cleavage/methylation domain-containing protein
MNEQGFTMVELLVATAMSLVVLALVGTSLVAYQNDTQTSTRRNDSQDIARTAVDRLVSELRNVASSRTAPNLVEVAAPYDLVFQTITSSPPASGSLNSAGIARVRYCLPPNPSAGNTGQQVLIKQTETWTSATAPTNPWPLTGGASTACPSAPSSLPGGTSITTTRLVEHVTNRIGGADRAAFSVDDADLTRISTVGVNLFVDADPKLPPVETSLRSSAFLRNQNQAPLPSCVATPTGGRHVLLNGGGSSDADNQQLSYEWFRVDGATTTKIGSVGLVDWTAPTSGVSYTFRLRVTDTGGLSATQDCSAVAT